MDPDSLPTDPTVGSPRRILSRAALSAVVFSAVLLAVLLIVNPLGPINSLDLGPKPPQPIPFPADPSRPGEYVVVRGVAENVVVIGDWIAYNPLDSYARGNPPSKAILQHLQTGETIHFPRHGGEYRDIALNEEFVMWVEKTSQGDVVYQRRLADGYEELAPPEIEGWFLEGYGGPHIRLMRVLNGTIEHRWYDPRTHRVYEPPFPGDAVHVSDQLVASLRQDRIVFYNRSDGEELFAIDLALKPAERWTVGGGSLAWEFRTGNATTEIAAYRIADGVQRQVTNENQFLQSFPAVWGEHVTWIDYNSTTGKRLMLEDLSSGVRTQLGGSESGKASIWKNRVVWSEARNGTPFVILRVLDGG